MTIGALNKERPPGAAWNDRGGTAELGRRALSPRGEQGQPTVSDRSRAHRGRQHRLVGPMEVDGTEGARSNGHGRHRHEGERRSRPPPETAPDEMPSRRTVRPTHRCRRPSIGPNAAARPSWAQTLQTPRPAKSSHRTRERSAVRTRHRRRRQIALPTVCPARTVLSGDRTGRHQSGDRDHRAAGASAPRLVVRRAQVGQEGAHVGQGKGPWASRRQAVGPGRRRRARGLRPGPWSLLRCAGQPLRQRSARSRCCSSWTSLVGPAPGSSPTSDSSWSGAGFIALGTVASTHKVAAVVAMAVVGFAVLFAGIVSPQAATASTAALLIFVLPVAVAAAGRGRRTPSGRLGARRRLLHPRLPCWSGPPPGTTTSAVACRPPCRPSGSWRRRSPRQGAIRGQRRP